jgi:hypothetical protein
MLYIMIVIIVNIKQTHTLRKTVKGGYLTGENTKYMVFGK